ncbi:phage head closure protein [Pseudomonas antarctica]|uniref:phage head closure protein n=1 Tax=Pseudomonas antarctica TaxID=219572 RepID=UPI00387AD3C0
MRAGDLRHRIRFQKLVSGMDPETMEPIEASWVDVATLWAAVNPLSGREFIQAKAAQSEEVGRIVIRYRSDIKAAMRGIEGDRVYNIQAVLPDPRSGREYLTLPYSEGVNDG